MNKISLFVRPFRSHPTLSEVRLLIDGVDLVELARLSEAPLASAEGLPEIAGEYAGLPARSVLPPNRHFLGEPEAYFSYNGRTQLLACKCGEPGCWPLTCRIEVSPSTVRWHDFFQPFRAVGGSRRPWHYEDLGPFTFAPVQYEEALRAAAEVTPNRSLQRTPPG